MERDSFVFYRSWLEAIENLPRDMQGDALLAITRYAIFGDASADGLKPIAKAMLTMAKPQIDVNNQRYVNGCGGGRKTKSEPNGNQTETKRKPKSNQNKTKPEPNENVNENDNVNVSSNEDNSNPHSPKGELPPLPGAALPQDEISVDSDDGLKASETTPPPGSAPPPSPRIDYSAIMRDFNTRFAGVLPAVTDMTEKRKAAVKARIGEHGMDSIAKVFDNIAASGFLKGHNDRNWKADFDWVFRPTNYVKILEGNYTSTNYGREKQQRFGATPPDDFAGKGSTKL